MVLGAQWAETLVLASERNAALLGRWSRSLTGVESRPRGHAASPRLTAAPARPAYRCCIAPPPVVEARRELRLQTTGWCRRATRECTVGSPSRSVCSCSVLRWVRMGMGSVMGRDPSSDLYHNPDPSPLDPHTPSTGPPPLPLDPNPLPSVTPDPFHWNPGPIPLPTWDPRRPSPSGPQTPFP
ncbi:unnamed protein product [Arctogadus glacialis]